MTPLAKAGATATSQESAAPMLLTVPEALALLRVCRATLYTLIGQGAFRMVKIGGGTRFYRSDLLEYIERCTIDYREAA